MEEEYDLIEYDLSGTKTNDAPTVASTQSDAEIREEVLVNSIEPIQVYIHQQESYIHQQKAPNKVTINSSGQSRSILASYLLWFFLGWAGIHHLYMGRGFGVWIISLITLQGFGIWWLADFFLIPISSKKIR